MTYYTPLIILVWLTLTVLGILTKENDRLSKDTKRILYFSFATVGAAALAEWLGVQLNGSAAVSPWVLKTVKFFDYTLTPLAGGTIILQFRDKSVWRRIMTGLLAVNFLYQIVSVFTGWMTTIDAENRYAHGPGYYVYVVLYLIIFLLVIVEFTLYGRRFRKQNRFSLYATLALTVTGILMQEIMGGEVRTAYVALTVCLSMLFIHNSELAQLASDDRIREQQVRISIDALTGISNRHAYSAAMEALDALDALPPDFVVFSIDINGLKAVNDTHGHHAGDELICGASSCISATFSPVGTCFRTGGDEFVVFANTEKENIPVLTAKLTEAAEAWRGKDAGTLSLSAGWAAAADHPDLTVEKLITAADMEMYKAKSAYYRESGLDRRKS